MIQGKTKDKGNVSEEIRGDTLPFPRERRRTLQHKEIREYIVSAEEMKRYDGNTIREFGVPSLVLMERAALTVVEELEQRFSPGARVLIVAGSGNNGGDGIAIGRILFQHGYPVEILFCGDRERCTPETAVQWEIAEKYGCIFTDKTEEQEYDIIVDALFGVGLSRPLEGDFARLVNWINGTGAFLCAVDLPSGVHADTGEIMGTAVQADLTVTFGFRKAGHIFYPGAACGGEVVCREIGIDRYSFLDRPPVLFTYTEQALRLLPQRDGGGNKGSFGKVLVIAGKRNMSGACQLCAESCYRMGAGMVKILTEESNRAILQTGIPEALFAAWPSAEGEEELPEVWMEWADSIVIGPGLGTDSRASELLSRVLEGPVRPLVIDADGLNLLAQDPVLLQRMKQSAASGRSMILTPHMGEFVRLYGGTVQEAKQQMQERVRALAEEYHCVIACKDARTLVCDRGEQVCYLNTTGNDGMATAGSGDVLAGIIGGLLAQQMDPFQAASLGVWIHGRAGDFAAARQGRYALMAGDLIRELGHVTSEKKLLERNF